MQRDGCKVGNWSGRGHGLRKLPTHGNRRFLEVALLSFCLLSFFSFRLRPASSTESGIYGQDGKSAIFFFLLSVKLVEQVDEGRILPNEFAEKGVAALQSVIDLLTGRRLS